MKVTQTGSSAMASGAGSESRNPAGQSAAYAYGKLAGRGNGRQSRDQSASEQGSNSGNTAPGDAGGQGGLSAHVVDAANLYGIPGDEITPSVEFAVSRLMGTIETLKGELERVHRHQQDLMRAASHDALTGLLGRKAFLQILENELSSPHLQYAVRSLMFCEISRMEALTQRHGHVCRDAVLTLFSNVIAGFVQPPHQLGYLGCNHFAALLINVDEQGGWKRAEAITSSLRDAAFDWRGHTVTCQPAFGVYQLRPGDTVNQALAATDGVLRSCREMDGARLMASTPLPQGRVVRR
ncbi:MAG: GGDEF domain-containing protein [Pseudomonadota bacterium]